MKALLVLPQSAPRLRPLTLTASPAMTPMLGAPLIQPLLVRLVQTGVTEITLLHECFSTEASDYFRDGRTLGALISHCPVEPGSSLQERLAAGLDGCDVPGAVLYAQAPGWTDASATELAAAHAAQGGGIRSVGADGARFAVLDPEAVAHGADWSEAQPLAGEFEWKPVTSLEQWWKLSQAALLGEVSGVTPPAPEPAPGIRTANPRSSWEQAELQGPVWIGPGSKLAPGAVIEGPAWIGAGCAIGPRVRLKRCIVEDQTRILERFELEDRYVIRNRAFGADGSTMILGDAMAGAPPPDHGPASDDLARLATRVAGLRLPVFR